MSLASRVCIVTGANKGIGYEIAKGMGALNFKVILACRNAQLGMEAKSKLAESGYDVELELLDIADSNSITSFVNTVTGKYPKIDVLINNAAIAFKAADPTPFNQQSRPTLRGNFFGTLELTEKLIPHLKKSDHPVIVTVASKPYFQGLYYSITISCCRHDGSSADPKVGGKEAAFP